MYIDDLVSGSTNLDEINNLKQKSINLSFNRGFNLHE